MAPAPRLFRIPEVAEHLACSRTHVYELLAAGLIRSVDIAVGPRSQVRIREDDLAAYVAQKTTKRKRDVAS